MLYLIMYQSVMKIFRKCSKPSFAKCVISPCKMRQLALQSVSIYPCDLTQIAVLFVPDSTLIQY